MKKYIIRWALKQIAKLYNSNISYAKLGKYGIEDILLDNAEPERLIQIVIPKK
jgi:hypothetical protein